MSQAASRIVRHLDAESARAMLLHEEIPDWLDIERRPTPKEKIMPALKTDMDEEERTLVARACRECERTPSSISMALFGSTVMNRWLRTGKGISPRNVAKAVEWANDALANPSAHSKPPRAPKPKPVPHDPAEIRRETISQVVELQRQALDQERQALEDVWIPPLQFEPYPPEQEAKPSRTVFCRVCRGWTRPGEGCACIGGPYTRDGSITTTAERDIPDEKPTPPEPDPSAYVFELWAVQKLAFTMETAGFRLPEGYRFRVTVERTATL